MVKKNRSVFINLLWKLLKSNEELGEYVYHIWAISYLESLFEIIETRESLTSLDFDVINQNFNKNMLMIKKDDSYFILNFNFKFRLF